MPPVAPALERFEKGRRRSAKHAERLRRGRDERRDARHVAVRFLHAGDVRVLRELGDGVDGGSVTPVTAVKL